MAKIFLPDIIVNKNNKMDNLKEIAKRLKDNDFDDTKGFLNINNVYIPYDYKITIDNKVYHINNGLANGTHRGELMGFIGAFINGRYNNYDELIDFITLWCKFDYKLINYNDINFIYIFNNKYKHMFDNNELE